MSDRAEISDELAGRAHVAHVRLTVNGRLVDIDVQSAPTLAEVLRDQLGMRGTKIGCGSGECGACTVLLNDLAVCSCVTLASTIADASVLTVEGLTENTKLSSLQGAFIASGAFQCGFCTSGMLMSACALLKRTPQPSEAQIRSAMQGNVCRCTGYVQILQAVRMAAARSS